MLQSENSLGGNKIRPHVAWMCLIVISLFEYVIDYSRFSFMNKHFIFLLCIFICLFSLLRCGNYVFMRSQTIVYVFIAFCLFGMILNSIDFSYLMHWICVLLALGTPISINQMKSMRKWLLIFGLFITASVIIQAIAPEIIYSIGSTFLNTSWKSAVKSFASWRQYAGLTYQTGMTSTIIVFGLIAYLCSGIDASRSKLLKYIPVVAMIVGLALTSKRMMFLVGIAIIGVWYICSMHQKGHGTSKIIFALLTLLLFAVAAISFLMPLLSKFNIFNRFQQFKRDGVDGTTGRFALYEMAFESFKSNPVFGIGWGTFRNFAGTDVHNVYLQVLAETGILGFIIFAIIFIYSLSCAIKASKFSIDCDTSTKNIMTMCLCIQVAFLLCSLTGNGLYELAMRTIYILGCVVPITKLPEIKTRCMENK